MYEEVRETIMKKWMLLLLALMILCAACPALADEFRPLPIDLSGGAPVKTRYSPQLLVYEDPTIRVERVREESKEWGFTYYLATVTIKDASQLRTASADNTFTSSAKVPATTMAKRNNAVLAVDGDFCASFSGNKANNYILRQGTVFRDTVEPGLDMLLIDEDGDFHVLTRDDDIEHADKTMINGKKVINAFQFGPAVVLNGEPVADKSILDVDHSPTYSEPDRRNQRMAIGQIDSLHYMVLSCAHWGTDLATFRDLALSLTNVKTLYMLDGGESAQMVFLGQKINNVVDGEQNVRPITDIIYFASAWFTD